MYPGNCRVTGIDISSEMLAVARKRIEILGLDNVDLECAGAESIDELFPEKHFDYVFAAFVISVVEDPVDVLRRVRKVGKDDCVYVLVNHFKSRNPVFAAFEKALEPVCNRIGWKNGVELEDVVNAAGMKVIARKKYLPTDIWTIVYAKNA
jgi:phosphatidylethanolamine/phosphatidyl-N-methylethanolamine N-methyltransferase